MNKTSLSVVMPFYNEAELLEHSIERVIKSASDCTPNFEVILVDNRSTDGSTDIAMRAVRTNPRVKMIRFSRNFGPTVEASMIAGLRHSSGDSAAVVCSDMQDPPELLPQMYAKFLEGYEVVFGTQTGRKGESLFRKITAYVFYKFIAEVSDSPNNFRSGDFFLLSKRVVDELKDFPERSRYLRGLIAWVGFESIGIPYVKQPRAGGRSKSRLPDIVSTAITGVTGFSNTPLRLLLFFSAFTTLTALIGLLVVFVIWVQGQTVPGVTTLIALGLLNLGLNIGALGIVGEYIARISTETKQRPLYIIDEKFNL